MRPRHASITLAFALLVAVAAHADEPAGTVASLQGRAESQRTGQPTWTALAVSQSVYVGDRVRTGDASRLKLLMRDDSVITLGARSELVIDAQVVRTDGGTSSLGLAVGALRAIVTERYGTKGSSFEVKTPTAIAGVRGTGFVALVDEDGKRTRVVGLYDVTRVRSITDAAGRHEVQIGPGEMTEIVAGGVPTKPRALPQGELQSLVAPTEMTPGAPSTPTPGGATGVPEEGSGDAGDPATPARPGGGALQRPDAVIDQPIDRLRGPQEPPPPPPRR